MAYKIYSWEEFENKYSELAQAWTIAFNYKYEDTAESLGLYPLLCIYGNGVNQGDDTNWEVGDEIVLSYYALQDAAPNRVCFSELTQDYEISPFENMMRSGFYDEDAYYIDEGVGHGLTLNSYEHGVTVTRWQGDEPVLWVLYTSSQTSVTSARFSLLDNYNPNGSASGEIIEEYYYPAKLPTPTLSIACDDAVVATITETESATTFHLEYRRSGTSTWNEYSGHIQSEESNSETVDLTDLLTGGKVYEFRAYCSDSSGEYENSAYSAVVSFKLFSKVAYKSVKSRTTSSISFFTTNLGLTSNTTWIAQYKKRGTDTWLTATTSNASSQLTVSSKTTLTADSVYDFRIRLKRSEGESTWFYVAQTTRSNKTAPAPSCTAGSTTIAATWTPPTGYYWYQLSAILNGTVVARNAWTQATSDTLTGLTPGKTYTVRVQYRITAEGDAYENDSFRGTVEVTTLQLLATPTGLSATNITSTSARLSWGAVTNAVGYKVEYRAVGASAWLEATE